MFRGIRLSSVRGCPVKPCPTVRAEATRSLQLPVAYRTLHTQSCLEPGALAFLFLPSPHQFWDRQSLFHTGRRLTERFRVEIRQHTSCFEEGQGDRAYRYRSKEWKAPSPSRLVRVERG